MGGIVAAGSFFAYLQSLGMTIGAAVPTLPAIVLPAVAPALPVVAVGGVAVAAWTLLL
jgi:hypothetical protein